MKISNCIVSKFGITCIESYKKDYNIIYNIYGYLCIRLFESIITNLLHKKNDINILINDIVLIE